MRPAHDFISPPPSPLSSASAVSCICRSWRGRYRENVEKRCAARKAAPGHFLPASSPAVLAVWSSPATPFGVQQMTRTPGPPAVPTRSAQTRLFCHDTDTSSLYHIPRKQISTGGADQLRVGFPLRDLLFFFTPSRHN